MVPGKYTDPFMTKFKWTFVDFTSTELSIQLNFEHVSYISSKNGQPDMIKLTIYGIQYFADNLGTFMYPPTVLDEKVLPPLASQAAVEAALSQV